MTNIRKQLALDNWDDYVNQLACESDKELEKKLDLIHLQSEIAERTKNIESSELLEIWHRQIIETRIYKSENNIPDAPKEIELAVADIKRIIPKSEPNEDISEETKSFQRVYKTKIKEDDQNQLTIF